MIEELRFKSKTRLLEHLGEHLIRNENVALLELVKNSYDADATNVNISLTNFDEPKNGIISIEDDGCGMDINVIKNSWMEIGSDYKEKLINKNNRTPKYYRLPLGDKGLGRFSIHKLGKHTEIISRKKNEKEIYFKINWEEIKGTDYLDKVLIKVEEREPQIFKNNRTGTIIIIKNLKNNWSRGTIREVYRNINSLSSPFDFEDKFKVNFECDRPEYLKDLLSWKKIQNYALFKFESIIEHANILSFNYDFIPYSQMNKLQKRSIKTKDINKQLNMVTKGNDPINLDDYKIGKVKFTGYIFDRDSKVMSFGVQDKQGLKEYLDQNGGIRIYRDGIRVYDYGEPGVDWLSLDIRRVNVPTKKISNNIIVSSILIDREYSKDLKEKTNREGFEENNAFFLFRDAILYVLNIIERLRNEDKEKIRTFYGPQKTSEPVKANISELKELVEKNITDVVLKKKIFDITERIESDYNEITSVLLTSAGAGLTLSIGLHEIEKIIEELKNVLKKQKVDERIMFLFQSLSDLVEGYSLVLRQGGKQNIKVKTLIEQAVFNCDYRLKAHNVSIVINYLNKETENLSIKVARNLIVSSIMNIIDNSLWWLNYARVKEKKILFLITIDKEYNSIVIADNGSGFAIPFEQAIKPFVSAKPDGMGLGLHIVDEIMKAHKGLLYLPEKNEYELPKEFKNGAVINLLFPIK